MRAAVLDVLEALLVDRDLVRLGIADRVRQLVRIRGRVDQGLGEAAHALGELGRDPGDLLLDDRVRFTRPRRLGGFLGGQLRCIEVGGAPDPLSSRPRVVREEPFVLLPHPRAVAGQVRGGARIVRRHRGVSSLKGPQGWSVSTKYPRPNLSAVARRAPDRPAGLGRSGGLRTARRASGGPAGTGPVRPNWTVRTRVP